MNCFGCLLLVICAATSWSQTSTGPKRREAEYYVAAYAQHYRVPVPLVRAVVERESNWRPCAISPKHTTRHPGRVDAAVTTFGSANDLASAMRRAASAHGEHEKRNGQHDGNWPDWYAAYMAAEQAGTELPR